jgi:hypothetical protein
MLNEKIKRNKTVQEKRIKKIIEKISIVFDIKK